MPLMRRKTDEEKQAERQARDETHAAAQKAWAEDQAAQHAKKEDLSRAKEEEKAAARQAQAEAQAARRAEEALANAAVGEHLRSVTKWEYQVKRIGEDKQKGLLGSKRMEEILNGEGTKGWELVAIHEERATFKRPLPSERSQPSSSLSARPAKEQVPPAPDADEDFHVVLASAGDKKIQVIKLVRAETGLGLKEAKDIVDGAPTRVMGHLRRESADKLASDLERAGATAEVRQGPT